MRQLTRPILVSLIVNMFSEEGHPFPYNKSVGEAARRLEWEHRAAVPNTCQIDQLPDGWCACLDAIDYTGSKVRLPNGRRLLPGLGSIGQLGRSIARYLRREILIHDQPTILFIEFFYLSHLIALLFALVQIPRRRISVWLLYRVDLYNRPTSLFVYKLLHMGIRLLIDRNRFQLMADSEPLAAIYTRYFGQTVQVMPVPHTDVTLDETDRLKIRQAIKARCGQNAICWWPGPARGDKGEGHIRSLASLVKPAATQICLVVTETMTLPAVQGGCQIITTPRALPRSDYLGWLHASDVILLPYDAKTYAERTSGIFVEAIAAGKPAPTTAGTWMANELLKYDLAELILDWNSPDLVNHLLSIAHDDLIQRKVAAMQAAYLQFHSVAGYARVMNLLVAR